MASRRLAANVHVRLEGGRTVTLLAGDEVPEDVAAYITNPHAWADEAPVKDDPVDPPVEAPEAPNYDALKKPELIRLAKRRRLSPEGTVAELRERLAASDND